MNYRDDNERLLVGCVSNQIIADGLKAEGFRSEIQSPVTADLRKAASLRIASRGAHGSVSQQRDCPLR